MANHPQLSQYVDTCIPDLNYRGRSQGTSHSAWHEGISTDIEVHPWDGFDKWIDERIALAEARARAQDINFAGEGIPAYLCSNERWEGITAGAERTVEGRFVENVFNALSYLLDVFGEQIDLGDWYTADSTTIRKNFVKVPDFLATRDAGKKAVLVGEAKTPWLHTFREHFTAILEEDNFLEDGVQAMAQLAIGALNPFLRGSANSEKQFRCLNIWHASVSRVDSLLPTPRLCFSCCKGMIRMNGTYSVRRWCNGRHAFRSSNRQDLTTDQNGENLLIT